MQIISADEARERALKSSKIELEKINNAIEEASAVGIFSIKLETYLNTSSHKALKRILEKAGYKVEFTTITEYSTLITYLNISWV